MSELNIFAFAMSFIITLVVGFTLSGKFIKYEAITIQLSWITAILFGFLIYYTTNWLFEKASLLLGF